MWKTSTKIELSRAAVIVLELEMLISITVGNIIGFTVDFDL